MDRGSGRSSPGLGHNGIQEADALSAEIASLRASSGTNHERHVSDDRAPYHHLHQGPFDGHDDDDDDAMLLADSVSMLPVIIGNDGVNHGVPPPPSSATSHAGPPADAGHDAVFVAAPAAAAHHATDANDANGYSENYAAEDLNVQDQHCLATSMTERNDIGPDGYHQMAENAEIYTANYDVGAEPDIIPSTTERVDHNDYGAQVAAATATAHHHSTVPAVHTALMDHDVSESMTGHFQHTPPAAAAAADAMGIAQIGASAAPPEQGGGSEESVSRESVWIYHEADVLSGRGASVNSHSGNKRFRALCFARKPEFQAGNHAAKRRIATEIVTHTMETTGARFLKRKDDKGPWQEMTQEQAILKAYETVRKCKWPGNQVQNSKSEVCQAVEGGRQRTCMREDLKNTTKL